MQSKFVFSVCDSLVALWFRDRMEIEATLVTVACFVELLYLRPLTCLCILHRKPGYSSFYLCFSVIKTWNKLGKKTAQYQQDSELP